MKRWILFCWLVLLLGLAGCSSDNTDTHILGSDPFVNPDGNPVVFALFDPGTQVMPLPNDVVWGRNDPAFCPNGQVCLTYDVQTDPADIVALSQLVNAQGLTGLSPNMFLTLPISGAVDPTTLDLLVFRTDDPQLPALLTALATGDLVGAGTAFAQMETRTETDFVVADGGGVIKLLPKTPFTPGAAYAVVVNATLLDSNGNAVTSSVTMRALKQTTPFTADSPFFSLEALRAKFNDDVSPTQPALFTVTQAVTAVANGGVPWTRDDTLVLWTYQTAATTLSLTPTTPGSDTVGYPAGGVDPFALTTAAFKGLSAGFTANNLTWLNVTVDPPAPSATPVGVPASALLAGTGIPTTDLGNVYFGLFQSPLFATGGATTDSVTFLISVPAAAAPAGGYPVVVFQHGITSDKSVALAIANTLAQAGYATLAIDAPFHGDRTVGASSGDGFFTANLLQNRANIYQAALDLWETLDVVEAGIDLDGVAGADLDATQIEFAAHSLGSIIGSVFLAQETRATKMILSSPSALLGNVLDATSLSDLQALVASLGYTKGTTPYYIFLNLAQWLLDPIDATYNGIGSNSTGNLLTVMAFADPIVTTDSTKVFLSNIGLDPAAIVSVDPDTVGVSFPNPATDFAAGAYEYGVAGKPIVHSFLLSPLFDPVADPYYAGYLPADQLNATTGAQMQTAGFLLTP